MRGAMKSFRKKTFKPQNFNAGSENTSLSFDLHVQRDNVKTGSVDIGESTTHNRNRFFREFFKVQLCFCHSEPNLCYGADSIHSNIPRTYPTSKHMKILLFCMGSMLQAAVTVGLNVIPKHSEHATTTPSQPTIHFLNKVSGSKRACASSALRTAECSRR